MPKAKRLWRAVALAIFIPGALLWFYTWALWSSYTDLPRRPIQAEGRIYPRGIHGITVYQTRQEQNKLDILLWVSIPASIAGFALAALEEERWRRSHPEIDAPKN
jgi:hypothetical protein